MIHKRMHIGTKFVVTKELIMAQLCHIYCNIPLAVEHAVLLCTAGLDRLKLNHATSTQLYTDNKAASVINCCSCT